MYSRVRDLYDRTAIHVRKYMGPFIQTDSLRPQRSIRIPVGRGPTRLPTSMRVTTHPPV
ncbi:unnamed protein product, partial [Nesidiocoris tenuis]